jgi:hypothetical protein
MNKNEINMHEYLSTRDHQALYRRLRNNENKKEEKHVLVGMARRGRRGGGVGGISHSQDLEVEGSRCRWSEWREKRASIGSPIPTRWLLVLLARWPMGSSAKCT